MYLIDHGWDEEKAFSLDDRTRAAFCIALSEIGGEKFDWDRMEWQRSS